MEELTASEIGNILGLERHTVNARLRKAGIKPVRMVGTTAIYSPNVVDKIREVSKGGRPSKNPENKEQ